MATLFGFLCSKKEIIVLIFNELSSIIYNPSNSITHTSNAPYISHIESPTNESLIITSTKDYCYLIFANHPIWCTFSKLTFPPIPNFFHIFKHIPIGKVDKVPFCSE